MTALTTVRRMEFANRLEECGDVPDFLTLWDE